VKEIRVEETLLVETDIRSPNSQTWAVACGQHVRRPWLADSPSCSLLESHHILHLGVAEMPSPFRIVRTDLGGSYFLASLEGEGRVLVDGHWLPSMPGTAFLLPPRTMNAFHTAKGKSWKFCWVRFQERDGRSIVARANSPVLANFDGQPLEFAVLGLRRECIGNASLMLLGDWLKLIRTYVLSFASPNREGTELWSVWDEVANDLDHPWTVAGMAQTLDLSEKQLQRICRRDLGRSPRQHLMWLRMRKAAELLLDTDRKISSIAASVGYRNPFVFTSTFQRMMGWTPSDYRRRHRTESSLKLDGDEARP
jgi:AraC-like DNA-binding protein